jgi:tripartite-type tricarboxylate transporter receptor subunit TctC
MKRHEWLGMFAVLAMALSTAASGQGQPVLKVVVGGPPGGVFDIALRNVSERLEKALGATVVIDNKPGAGGAVAVDFVKNAKPDGWTVAMLNVAAAANESLIKNKGYNLLTDLEPVGMYAYPTNILIVNPGLKATSVPGLVAELKAQGSANYSSGGIGSPGHLAC